MLLVILLLLNGQISEQKPLSLSESQNMWNLLNLRNFHLVWELSSNVSYGTVIKSFNNLVRKGTFLVEVTPNGKVSITLPLSTGNLISYTSDLKCLAFPCKLFLVVGDNLQISTAGCSILMNTPLSEIDFKRIVPEFTKFLSVSIRNVHFGSGNPLSQLCTIFKNIPDAPEIEELELHDSQHSIDSSIITSSRPIENVSCSHEDELFGIGESRGNGSSCHHCICTQSGQFECGQKGCAPLNCEYPLADDGQCCPTRCARNCSYNSRNHGHGDIFWPEKCVRCSCNDGTIDCSFRRKMDCPVLPCPRLFQRTVGTDCCPTCFNFDFCSLNPCHSNASCTNSATQSKCRCREGFFGNGTICYDIDECGFDQHASEQLGGCGSGTYCVNTPGSFRCECLPGHPRMNDRTCLNLIRV